MIVLRGKGKVLLRLIFAVYACSMLYFLFFRNSFSIGGTYWEHVLLNINAIPLRTISQNLILILNRPNPYLVPYAILNLSGNVIGFIPFGILFPHLFKKRVSFTKFVLYALIIIASVEFIQLFTLRGSCDIDDLILNMLGSMIGYPFGRFAATLSARKSQKNRIYRGK